MIIMNMITVYHMGKKTYMPKCYWNMSGEHELWCDTVRFAVSYRIELHMVYADNLHLYSKPLHRYHTLLLARRHSSFGRGWNERLRTIETLCWAWEYHANNISCRHLFERRAQEIRRYPVGRLFIARRQDRVQKKMYTQHVGPTTQTTGASTCGMFTM